MIRAGEESGSAASVAQSKQVQFTLNGIPVHTSADQERSLLSVLREDFGCTSLKNGCEPQASCGCCTLLVDGKARVSCTMKPQQVAGKQIVTLEGLPEKTRTEISDCFVNCGGVQCGFCIPGMAMRGYSVVKDNANPSRQQIAHELRGHVCRCTGYVKILDAIEQFAQVRRGEEVKRTEQCGKIGTALNRYRGKELVLGDFKYIDDIEIDGSLYAAMRYSDHPRARLKSIDIKPAMSNPGVTRVITAADIPGDRIVGLITKDWPILVAIGEETRCMGDVIAVVVAEDIHTARKAAEKLAIEYEVLTPVTSPEEALEPEAPKVHAKGNLLSKSYIHRGDSAAAFAASTHIVEDTFTTQRIEHLFLEPESCIAIPNGGDNGAMKLRVLSQGQGVFDDQRQIAAILGWDIGRVQVELVQNGGAFGGKEDLSIQGQTALAAALCGRPVKCTLTRDDSFRLHPKRHPIKMHFKVGCDAEGRLTAVWARMIGDKGAYASVGAKVLERAAGHACGPYRVPVVDVEALAVYTNNPPCGAMRGFGANQSAFAIETLLNRLARKVGIDDWEMRFRNILVQGDRFATGQILHKPFGLKKTLLAVKDQYKSAKIAGIACGIKNVGIGNGMPDPGKAIMRVEPDGTVSIRTGFTEMGQGYFTVLIQTAVEETGLSPAIFLPRTDTSADLNCGQTTASRATVLGCKAVSEAAKQLKAELNAGKSLADLVGREFRGDWVCNDTTKLGADVADPKTHLTYGFATQVVILNDDGSIKKVIAAHDVGKVMNPILLQGQMEGSLHMGLGYALTEDFVCENGRIVSDTIKSVGVLRAHQMPELECIFVEEPDPETAYGSRGVGEIGLVPTAPAVAGALTKFDGIERTTLPMKDSPAARAILAPSRK
jgi:xanthine dehydrogenase molybdenum-binding subunit